MEKPLLLTYGETTKQNDDVYISPQKPQSTDPPPFTDPGEALCLVPIRWWEEAGSGIEVGEKVLYEVETEEVDLSDVLMTVDGFEEKLSKQMSFCLRRGEEGGFDGEAFALVSEWMFCTALKGHYVKKGGNLAEGQSTLDIDLFSLRISVLYGPESNSLVVKIRAEDNGTEDFNCASNLFCSNTGTLQIWDFSGQTDQLFLDDMKQFKDSDQSYEIVKELWIYGLSCPVKEEERGKEVMVVEQPSMADDPTSSSSTLAIVCIDKVNLPSAIDSGDSGSCPVKEEDKGKEDMVMEQHTMVDELNSISSTVANGCIDKVNLPSASDSGFSGTCPDKEEERRNEDMVVDEPASSSSTKAIGCMEKMNLPFQIDSGCSLTSIVGGPVPSVLTMEKVNLPSASDSWVFSLGLTGLNNLGNTCFMNSAIQCLVHMPKLGDYFLGNFRRDLNFENPLGMNGKLAIVFGHLLRRLWVSKTAAIRPNLLKSTISKLTTQFSGGHVQHDSQEFLAFLLNGLHEDLNRVKGKPYVEDKDVGGRLHEEVADEYWENHLSRNDSIIIDLCQGQERSTLTCPDCRKSSVKFDPYMYLTLQIPSTTLRKMTLTVLSHGSVTPDHITVMVPKNGTYLSLQEVVAEACSLREDETLRIAKINYNREIHCFLDNPCDLVEKIRDSDHLVAYKLPKGESRSNIHEAFLELIDLLLLPNENSSHNIEETENIAGSDVEEAEMYFQSETGLDDTDLDDADPDFEYSLETRSYGKHELELDMPVPIDVPVEVIVNWPKKMMEECNTFLQNEFPRVFKSEFMEDSVSLYKCMEAYLTEEPLGPEDMWYCPNCKKHKQASKKLDLWRLPEILVINLKRFSYNASFENIKLETPVDFPVDNFDISDYVTHKNENVSPCYDLYALTNHIGGSGGGHYTSFVRIEDIWCKFDDSVVTPVDEEQIKTSAAYLLFYKRKVTSDSGDSGSSPVKEEEMGKEDMVMVQQSMKEEEKVKKDMVVVQQSFKEEEMGKEDKEALPFCLDAYLNKDCLHTELKGTAEYLYRICLKMVQIWIGTSLTAIHLGESAIMGSDGMASNGDLSQLRMRRKIFKIIPGLYIGCAGNKDRALEIKDMIKSMFKEPDELDERDMFARPDVPRTVEAVVEIMKRNLRKEDEVGFIVAGRVLDQKMNVISISKRWNEGEVVKIHKKGDVVNLGTGAKHMFQELGDLCVDNEDEVIKFVLDSLLKGIKGDTRSGGFVTIILIMKMFVRRLISDHRNNYIGFKYDKRNGRLHDADEDGRTGISDDADEDGRKRSFIIFP